VFTSDNGADSTGSNAPLRGGKGTLFEGGIRAPMVTHALVVTVMKTLLS